MLNCSLSFSRLRWLLEVVLREDDVVQKDLRSGGEGGR